VKVPTTVVYGSCDSIVPPEQSRAVAAVAAGETRVVEIVGADHNDLALLEGEKLIEAVASLPSGSRPDQHISAPKGLDCRTQMFGLTVRFAAFTWRAKGAITAPACNRYAI
jgi:hypothetical protein